MNHKTVNQIICQFLKGIHEKINKILSKCILNYQNQYQIHISTRALYMYSSHWFRKTEAWGNIPNRTIAVLKLKFQLVCSNKKCQWNFQILKPTFIVLKTYPQTHYAFKKTKFMDIPVTNPFGDLKNQLLIKQSIFYLVRLVCYVCSPSCVRGTHIRRFSISQLMRKKENNDLVGY